MTYKEATRTARAAIRHLSPHCERCEIAGSIRRQKRDNIKDVELVVIPKMVKADMFGLEMQPVPGFIQVVNGWQKIKGDATGKYTQRILPNGVTLDLFIATPQNWGMIYLIRTGPADYVGKRILGRFKRMGYKSVGGHPTHQQTGEVLKFAEEADVFAFLGMDFVQPKDRCNLF